jgi:hypothetical protein
MILVGFYVTAECPWHRVPCRISLGWPRQKPTQSSFSDQSTSRLSTTSCTTGDSLHFYIQGEFGRPDILVSCWSSKKSFDIVSQARKNDGPFSQVALHSQQWSRCKHGLVDGLSTSTWERLCKIVREFRWKPDACGILIFQKIYKICTYMPSVWWNQTCKLIFNTE